MSVTVHRQGSAGAGAPGERPAVVDLLVAEDDEEALEELVGWLGRHQAVRSAAATRQPGELLRYLHVRRFDAVFLGLDLPGLDVIELAGVLTRFAAPPAIVFLSRSDERMVEAFDVGPTDYLVKPFGPDRLALALQRIVAHMGGRPGRGDPVAVGAPLRPGLAEEQGAVAVDSGHQLRLLRPEEVLYVEARGDYVRLHTATATYLVRAPISTLESNWAGSGFVRVHRGYLVPLRQISELRRDGRGACVVRVGPTDLPVSRRHARDLKDRLTERTTRVRA